MKTVKLIPIKKNNWSGVTHYKDCSESLAPYWLRNGNVYTGLEKLEEVEIKELSSMMGGIDLGPKADFWKTFTIKMTSKPLILTLDNAFDRIRYYFLLNHKDIASSYEDKKPHTKYVLEDEESSAKKSNERNIIERKAVKGYDALSPAQKRKALKLYGISSDITNDEVVDARLYELVKENPDRFIKLWIDNSHRDIQLLIDDAIKDNVIRVSKNLYYYGSDIIGRSLEDTINFLEDLRNQEILLAVKNSIKAKV